MTQMSQMSQMTQIIQMTKMTKMTWVTGWQEALQTIDRIVYFMNNASADSVSQKFYLHGWFNMYIYSIQEQKWVI